MSPKSDASPVPQPVGPGTLARFLEDNRPYLVILAGAARNLEIQLDQSHLTLGRGPGADITFDDPALATVHADICFTGDSFEVRDLGSDSGTRLNGARVAHDVLKNGDRLQLGSQVIEFDISPRGGHPRADRTAGSDAFAVPSPGPLPLPNATSLSANPRG